MGVRPKPPNPPLWVRHALPIPLGREGTGEKERRREEMCRNGCAVRSEGPNCTSISVPGTEVTKQIRSSLDYDMASALVSSSLDHVNSILYGAASKHTNRLQHIQKALARTVMHQRSHGSPLSSTALLKNLHWLPIEWHIRFKLATLAYKALHTGQPPYRAD